MIELPHSSEDALGKPPHCKAMSDREGGGRGVRAVLHVATALAVATAAGLLATACGSLSRESRAVFVLSVHAFARPDLVPGRGIQYLTDYAGSQRVAVKRFPIISSRSIISAEVVDDDASRQASTLRCLLDRHGSTLWIQAARTMPGEKVAVAVDGFYVGSMRLPMRVANPSIVDITGTWSRKEAERVAEQAQENYEALTGRSVGPKPE